MAADTGFEPVNHSVKGYCLTTWLYPYIILMKFHQDIAINKDPLFAI